MCDDGTVGMVGHVLSSAAHIRVAEAASMGALHNIRARAALSPTRPCRRTRAARRQARRAAPAPAPPSCGAPPCRRRARTSSGAVLRR
eukprot:6713561-Prymnesium_polylepis.1